jgi:hypothetical protein
MKMYKVNGDFLERSVKGKKVIFTCYDASTKELKTTEKTYFEDSLSISEQIALTKEGIKRAGFKVVDVEKKNVIVTTQYYIPNFINEINADDTIINEL